MLLVRIGEPTLSYCHAHCFRTSAREQGEVRAAEIVGRLHGFIASNLSCQQWLRKSQAKAVWLRTYVDTGGGNRQALDRRVAAGGVSCDKMR